MNLPPTTTTIQMSDTAADRLNRLSGHGDNDTAPTSRVSRMGRLQAGGRALPNRSKSGFATPTPRAAPNKREIKRSQTGGDIPRVGKKDKTRKKKKGIRVAVTVRKRTDADVATEDKHTTSFTATTLPPGGDEKKDDSNYLNIYQLQVNCTGKYSRKSCWDDVNSFWTSSPQEVNKDSMCDLLADYIRKVKPDHADDPNLHPKRCYLQDCAMRGITYYKDYDWDPVKLNLKGRDGINQFSQQEHAVEIQECWTRQVKLEEIPIDHGLTDIEKVLIQQGDTAVTSTLKKSKLQGHPLALSMMTSDTQIVTELRGLESTCAILGNDDDTMPPEFDDDGNQVWRDVKSLRALLHDKPIPEKEGKGQHRILEVVGLETYLKARVYYKAFFDGDVVSDHGSELFINDRWWCFPLKDILMGYQQHNSAEVYEDIELRFFSEINYQMENEYFDWENHAGKWVKVKKVRQRPYEAMN